MSSLPLGGKLLAKRGDEGQSISRQLVFNPKKRHFPNRPSLSPLKKAASACEPIEVKLNFSRCSPPYEKNPTARRRIQLFCPVSVL